MAYFLKKTKQKNRTYLAIYESFYNPDKKSTSHKCYRSLGSLETLLDSGIQDPVSFYQNEVDQLNRENNETKTRKISESSPILYMGYFPLKNIMNKLQVKGFIDLFHATNDFQFDLFSVLSSLIYARCVNPCSKYRTFHDVIPYLYETYDYSYDQLLDALAFLGGSYEKIVELFTSQTAKIFGLNTEKSYFDCTNFYFEIDREDDLRRKGPSKENRKDPIVGLGLILDRNLIPVGMKIYPGNASEKPVLRNIIGSLKKQNNIKGKTIHVADKGLNCAENIAFSKKNGDGYLFSKSVKQLPDKEKDWVLLDKDWTDIRDAQGSLLYRRKSCTDKFPYEVEHNGQKVKVLLTEKRLLTYNPELAAKKKYEIHRMAEKALSLSMSKAKKSECGESGKYISFTDSDGNKAAVSLNQDAIDRDLKLAGYNLLVTSELSMSDDDIYDTYHNLWRIEESFRIMKSDLDARPVFLHKEESIKGHFLICYLTVLLERILQFKVLDDRYSSSDIFSFFKNFKVVKIDHNYINTTAGSKFIDDLSDLFNLPLTNYFLSDRQLQAILNHQL